MGRKVKGKTLDTIEARRKVKPQGKPYYRAIDRGLHLGYRKLKGQAGTWLARHYLGDQAYEVEAAVISPSETAAGATTAPRSQLWSDSQPAPPSVILGRCQDPHLMRRGWHIA